MSTDLQAAAEAVKAACATRGEGDEWELVCKRSVGASLARRREEPPQSERWVEEALAVRVLRADGRSALASAAGWGSAEATAVAAWQDASRQALPCGGSVEFAPPWEEPVEKPVGEDAPPSSAELSALLDTVLEAAAEADARTAGLELGRARAARVTTRLLNSRGLDLTMAQDLAHLEAEVVGRVLSKHAGCSDAVAAARVDREQAWKLGDRLGRALRRQFDGLPRAPGQGRVLLSSEVVGEITFRLAPALLGLEPASGASDGSRLSAGLRLREDSAEDLGARSAPADGVGRPLGVVELSPDGRLARPEPGALPLVRPGIADPPRPGWLRLSWSSENGRSDEELVTELGSGLLVERAVTESIDSRRLRWRGQVEGWWVEGGVGKRAVARLPLSLDLPSLLPSLLAVGAEPRPAHASGTIRALSWLLPELPVGP